MIGVDEARALIDRTLKPLGTEMVTIGEAAGRTLAAPIVARMTQPPFAASAMDGYAVRFSEARRAGARLGVAGEARAGGRFPRALPRGMAVRIFTGSPVPVEADHILIQEDADRIGDEIVVKSDQTEASHIRAAGIDFRAGETLIEKGALLTGPLLVLAAGANEARLEVSRRPKVALIANGDELRLPGDALGRDEIVCSIPFGLKPMIDAWGGDARFLGVARDDPAHIRQLAESAASFDLILPIGGASVGDRDFMRRVFADLGAREIFSKVAMKPGKPASFSLIGERAVIGLPGNPASALVGAVLFVQPALRRLLGRAPHEDFFRAVAGAALPANGPREAFLRVRIMDGEDGRRIAIPLANQDSALMSVFAAAGALLRRPAGAPPAAAGTLCPCLEI